MDRYEIVNGPLTVSEALDGVADPAVGGVVVFLGVVRNEFESRPSQGLHYEAYRAMAEQEMARIGASLKARHGVLHVIMQHRVGTLSVTEPSVLVAVSAPHRAAAFAACEEAIDRLKAEVPIWKKELWADGAAAWHDDPPVEE